MSGSGEKPSLALAPGHLCDMRLYAPQRALLEARCEIIAVDTGLDDDLGAMAGRFLATAPPRFAIMGLSMGGMIAMELLARAPERVIGAALLDTDPTPAREKEIAWREDMLAKVAEDGLAAFVEPFVASFFRHDGEAGERLSGAVREMMLSMDQAVFSRQARALSARRDLRDAVAAYDGPLAVIWGAEDRVCPPLLHAPLAGRARDAQPREIPGCGHLSTLERPVAVTEALAAWLDRLAA